MRFVNSQSDEKYQIDLSVYNEQFYQMSLNSLQAPIITTDNSIIIIENLNGIKNKKTDSYRIDYYSIILITK
jgi:uncharacterized protein (DUF2126 family)